MILPVGASTFKEAMKMGVEVYHHLKVCHIIYLFILSHYYVQDVILSSKLVKDSVLPVFDMLNPC